MICVYLILAFVVAILLILVFALFSPLAVRIRYFGEMAVYVSISFITFKVFPRNKNKKQHRKKKNVDKKIKLENTKKKTVSQTQQEILKNTEAEKEKKSFYETLSLILDIIKSLLDMMGKSAKIRIDVLRVVISKADAADTAIQFGLCSGILSSILAFTSNFGESTIKDENVSIVPDFITGKSSIETDITVSAKAISIFAGLVSGFVKNKSKK